MKRWMAMAMVAGWSLLGVGAATSFAQEAVPQGMDLDAQSTGGDDAGENMMGFGKVVSSGGTLGVILWLALGLCSVAGISLIVDSFITIKEKKIVPQALVDKVREAMEQGDVVKALGYCDEEPGPLANVLAAGFSNVQEGYDVVQEAVGVAADLESEKLLQRVTYLNVVANLAPMLGLLGTVQGMIAAFAVLGTQQAGAMQQSLLAVNIAMALYTTAAGLASAVPALGFYYYFRNKATKIILGMEGLTLDLIKVLRNVEVVSE